MPWESPPIKKEKQTDSDEEDDVDVDKAIERTEKQAKARERNIQQSRNVQFLSHNKDI